jgi:hypothetical protein
MYDGIRVGGYHGKYKAIVEHQRELRIRLSR